MKKLKIGRVKRNLQRKEEEIKHFKNISLTSLRNRPHFGKAIANYLILNELVNAADGMETSKRRDCDRHLRPPTSI